MIRLAALCLTFSLAACDKSDASSSPTQPEPATDAAPDADSEADASAEAEADAKRWAERLAAAESKAETRAERWTPELEEAVNKLVEGKTKTSGKKLAAILASDHRAPGNADRDQYRHPAETLQFFGIAPSMRVFEFAQGGGWYTEILAPYLAKDGALVLAKPSSEADDPRGAYSQRAAELFIESSGNLYANVEHVEQPAEEGAPIAFGPAASLDAILVFRMMHNVHRAKLWERLMPSAFASLKPGGVLAVVQHRAKADANVDDSAEQGYVPEAWLIEKVESYGFELAEKSEINANPKDTKDYADGVWTLPPILTKGDENKETYVGIGESDRSTLKFVKPAK